MLIIRLAANLPYRWCPLSSNVRRHQMHSRRLALFSLPALLLVGTTRAQSRDIAALSPARVPVVAEQYGIAVAAIFVSSNAAQLLIYRETTEEERSPVFEFPLEANFGSAWVEQVKPLSANSFLVAVRTRQTCGLSVHDYFFSKLQNTWVLAQLDRAESQCSDTGNFLAWKTTYDYLARRTKSTKFSKSGAPKTSVRAIGVKVVRLVEFHALDPSYESDA